MAKKIVKKERKKERKQEKKPTTTKKARVMVLQVPWETAWPPDKYTVQEQPLVTISSRWRQLLESTQTNPEKFS